MKLSDRIQHAWHAFTDSRRYPTIADIGSASSYPSTRVGNLYKDSTIVNTIFNRIAIDVASVEFRHVKVIKDTKNSSTIESKLNDCISVEANIDQTSKQFFQDLVESMLEEGVVAVVPIETDTSALTEHPIGRDIVDMRVGKILQWYPKHVKVSVYNDNIGKREEVLLHKRDVAIIESPLYSTINGENATLKRLIRKLSLLDAFDEKINSNKLDLIIQFPYVVKTSRQIEEAKARIESIEKQLTSSALGIAYTSASEKITQLNRPVTNNLLTEIQYLTDMLYNQLGLTANILNGTANEVEQRTYHNRTIEPIITAITKEFDRKFLSKTARSQGHKITYYRNHFTLVPVEQLASIADVFSRNAIVSPNEIRAIIGFEPDPDRDSDMLRNRNMPLEGVSTQPMGGDGKTTVPSQNEYYEEEV